jgi:hypothetical protein
MDEAKDAELRFVMNGTEHTLTRNQVRSRVDARTPEPIFRHWVEIGGRRWPVKQAFEAAVGINRNEFTSQTAGFQLSRLGFETSRSTVSMRGKGAVPATASVESMASSESSAAVLTESFKVLAEFFGDRPFTSQVADLESKLLNAAAGEARDAAESSGFSTDLLSAALAVRERLGRFNDVIHATAIASALPLILEAEETVVNRPSLAAGNDATRHFDLETTKRVAEFKIAIWKGSDGARQRSLFADLVNLTLDTSGRARELYVVGDRPGRFLRTSKRRAGEVLGKNSSYRTRDAFASLGEDLMTVAEFTATADVRIIDLTSLMPGVFAL